MGPARICIPRSKVAGHGLSSSSLKSGLSVVVVLEVMDVSREPTVEGELLVELVVDGMRGETSEGVSMSLGMMVVVTVEGGTQLMGDE